MAKKAKEKTKEGVEIFENPDALVEKFDKTEDFLKKNRNAIYIFFGVLIVGAGAFFFWQENRKEANLEAEREIYETEYVFEEDSIAKARSGFEFIVDEYSGTEAANRAHFALGMIYLEAGDFEGAIEELKSFSSEDAILQGRAYSLIGDANMELTEYAAAADYYKKASEYKPNQFYTPVYIIKQCLALELAGENEEAIKQYEYLTQKYPSAYQQVNEAKKRKAMLEAKKGDE